MRTLKTRNLVLLTAVAALALAGCYPKRYACYRTCASSTTPATATTYVKPLPPPRAKPAAPVGVKPSGFLSDYGLLKVSPERSGSYVWEKEGLDLRVYDRILIEPIRVLLDEPTYAKVPQEAQQKASEYFERILRETIAPYYAVVEAPGEHVLRVKLALTDLQPASGGEGGEPAVGTGGAELEGEFLDAVTGERLLMVVSRIEGSQDGSTDVQAKWQPVEGAFRQWASRILDYLDSFHE